MPEWRNVEISQLVEITDGWETEVFSFDIKNSSGHVEEKVVLRMYSGPHAVNKARKEFSLLKHLYEASYPVPRVLLVEEESSHLGRPFLIMERVEGNSMWSLLEAERHNQDSHLYRLFSTLFHGLHTLDWRQLIENPEGIQGLNSKRAAMSWIEKFESRALEIGERELLEIIEWLKMKSNEIAFEQLSATHNDFHPANILMDRDGNPFVIDWTAADLMDYRVDLAWTLLLVKVYVGDAMRDTILRGYESVSQKTVEDIPFFEVLGCLRRLTDILVTLTTDSGAIGLREGAAESIREQLKQNMTLLDIVKDHTGLDLPYLRKLMVGQKT
ncbi:MAG: phosphotransferase family protein [Candidatus Thorarchaeota archaeon]